MAGRPKLQHGTNALQAGVLLLAFLSPLPVVAAPVLDTRCDESFDSSLEAVATELNARPASSSDEALEGHLLEQRIEAAARSVFAEDEPEDTEKENETADETPPAKTSGPTASDREPSSFRRQMYRRDI
jgi:hypothetical protein